MSDVKKRSAASSDGLNRAKLYQLVLFPLNNGATNVYFVLILSYVAQFGSSVLKLGIYASLMVTIMRVFDAVTDPIIASMSDRCKSKAGRRIPFMRVAAIPFALSCMLTFWSPVNRESWLNAGFLFLMLMLF